MVTFDEFLTQHLDQYRKVHGQNLRLTGELKIGDLVNKSGALVYRIDDPESVLSKLGEHKDFPYSDINKMLRSDASEILKLFNKDSHRLNGNRILPFSRVVYEGLGECLEKAVLSQLSLQNFPFIDENFLVAGNMTHDSEPLELENHAFNLAKRNGKWALIDTENPYRAKNQTMPYIAPVEGVELKGLLPIEIPPEKRAGRTYFLRI